MTDIDTDKDAIILQLQEEIRRLAAENILLRDSVQTIKEVPRRPRLDLAGQVCEDFLQKYRDEIKAKDLEIFRLKEKLSKKWF